MGVLSQIKHAWNAFLDRPAEPEYSPLDRGTASSTLSNRRRVFINNERSIIEAIYVRLSLDVAGIDMRHVRVDSDGRYKEDVNSGLHQCLQLEANIDQTARALRQDMALSMFDEGCIAVVPVDTARPTSGGESMEILTMRVGRITQFWPQHVEVDLLNDRTGRHERLPLAKSQVAILENPFYAVMNEPNSMLRRLSRKLNILDAIDEHSGSGRLDLIIQLPYQTRSALRQQQADERKRDIESQLKDSPYGIGYIDATEKITQLNRPVENNLLKQIEYLTAQVYAQLGLTTGIMDGTADESTMLNYECRTIEPIVALFAQEFKRKFLSKTARTQGHHIAYFRDPFRFMPMSQVADIADKFSRNEITSSNEIRGFIGLRPSKDPKADELNNSNMPPTSTPPPSTDAPES